MEVKSGSDGFLVKMADGSLLQCAHNSSEGSRLPDYAAQPAMVLKLQDGSDILLPLIVCKPRTVPCLPVSAPMHLDGRAYSARSHDLRTCQKPA